MPGAITARGRAGANRLRFQGRLTGTRRLAPGSYRLTLIATDPAGNRSRPATARFTLLRTAR